MEASADMASHGGRARTGRVFECRTCGRRFPTFQALGGHRASHRRPSRPYVAAPPRPPPRATTRLEARDEGGGYTAAAGSRAHAHGCPVCGLEFAAGQALGGHMRRHRAMAADGRALPLRSGDAASSAKGDEDAGTDCGGGICLDLSLAPSEKCVNCRKNAGLDRRHSVHNTLILDCPL